jgi:hypothetical protein
VHTALALSGDKTLLMMVVVVMSVLVSIVFTKLYNIVILAGSSMYIHINIVAFKNWVDYIDVGPGDATDFSLVYCIIKYPTKVNKNINLLDGFMAIAGEGTLGPRLTPSGGEGGPLEVEGVALLKRGFGGPPRGEGVYIRALNLNFFAEGSIPPQGIILGSFFN